MLEPSMAANSTHRPLSGLARCGGVSASIVASSQGGFAMLVMPPSLSGKVASGRHYRSSGVIRSPFLTPSRVGRGGPFLGSVTSTISPGVLEGSSTCSGTVSYTHLRAHETPEHLVCRLL